MCGKSAWWKKECIARAEQYRKGRAWRREDVTITSTRIMAAFCHCAAILSRLLLRLLLAANAARLIAATVEAKIHVPPTSVPSIYLSLSLPLSVFLCTLESSGNGNCVNKVRTALQHRLRPCLHLWLKSSHRFTSPCNCIQFSEVLELFPITSIYPAPLPLCTVITVYA